MLTRHALILSATIAAVLLAPVVRARVIDTHAVSIAGDADAWRGRLDLGDSDLVLRSTPAAEAGDFARIVNQIQSGRRGGPWGGPGITSSAAARNPATGLAAILNDKGGQHAVFTTFDGHAVDADCILVKYTYNGDTDFSGTINSSDYLRVDYGFLARKAGWRNGDFNYDDKVNADDYGMIDAAYLTAPRALPPSAHSVGPLVPEPAILAPLALAMLALRRVRLHRSH